MGDSEDPHDFQRFVAAQDPVIEDVKPLVADIVNFNFREIHAFCIVVRQRDHIRIFIGSLIVALGMSIAGVSAFNSDFYPTFVGFIVFFSGYVISQRGIPLGRRANNGRLLKNTAQHFSIKLLFRVVFIFIGGLLATWGVILFADAVINPNHVSAIVAGIACTMSYISTHIGINGTLL